MSERSKEHAWKVCIRQPRIEGSNPSLSAILKFELLKSPKRLKGNISFDLKAASQGLPEGKGLSGKDGVLTPLIKRFTEAAMQART